MRNNLAELPVLLCCIWGGAFAGAAAFLLQLPKRIYDSKHRGLRRPFVAAALFALFDVITCAAAALTFAAALVYANGGELRAYAVLGWLISLAVNVKLLNGLFM